MKLIASAFIKAKREFGPALKDKTNPAFRSKYADLGACIDAVDDALLNHGIAFVQHTFEDATGITVETVFLHDSGETMACGKLHVPASKQDPQGYGSALTYARRYSLMTACGIAAEDDDGNAASKAKPKIEQPKTGAMADVIAQMPELAPDDKLYFDELAFNVADLFASKGQAVAFDRVKAEGLDSDQTLYLWSRLKSNVRSGLKVEKGLRNGSA